MRRSRWVAVGLATAVLAAGGVVAVVTTGARDSPSDGSATPTDERPLSGSAHDAEPVEPPADLADLELPGPGPSGSPLEPARGPEPDARAVRAVLAPVLRDRKLGRHVGVVVRDLGRDRPVLTAGGPDPYIPASTLKLFTAAAVLAQLGPDHRFTTSVVLEPGGPGPGATRSVVLIGGGDPYLASRPPTPSEVELSPTASVTRLAVETARALRARDIRRVQVGYDASLFTGPTVAPSWEPDYVPSGTVNRVAALWVDEGQAAPGSADPAFAAGGLFAEALRRAGVRVDGPLRETAPRPRADVLADASGADLDSVVAYVLEVSDNEGAEVLLRHVGLATGRSGSFAGGVAGMREVLTGLGVPYAGVRTYDGSGLSRDNRVTLPALAQVLQLGTDPDRPDLRTVTSGLAVAGFSGSLAYRFLAPEAELGRGVVRAKTGTLTKVNGLAGTVVTRDETLLGFGLLTDRVRVRDTVDARALLDELAAALASCGCAG